jgi:hypothetical protein
MHSRIPAGGFPLLSNPACGGTATTIGWQRCWRMAKTVGLPASATPTA